MLPSRLRNARLQAGLGQAVVAAAIGVSQQQYANWETGTIPPAKHHAALAKTLGVDEVLFLRWIADAYREREEAKSKELATARREYSRLVDYIEEQNEKAEQRAEAIAELMQRVEQALNRAADELNRARTRNR